MQKPQKKLTLLASLFFLCCTPIVAQANDLPFGDVQIGSAKVLRLSGGLALSLGSTNGGGSCAKGIVASHLDIAGPNQDEFQDLGGTYIGLHLPGSRYYEEIRFTPKTVGEKVASISPVMTPVSPMCGLHTRTSNLSGRALAAPPSRHIASVKPQRMRPRRVHHTHTPKPHVQATSRPISVAQPAMLPSIPLLAEFSLDSYNGNASPQGYRLLGDTSTILHEGFDPHGFIALAHRSVDGTQIVIAIRGSATGQTSLRDGLFTHPTSADTKSFAGIPRKTLIADMQAAGTLIATTATRYPNATITLTGHSFGGAIAQFLSGISGDSAYVFDAPGSKQLFMSLAIPFSPFPVAHTRNYQNINIRISGDQVSFAGIPLAHTLTLEAPIKLRLSDNTSLLMATACTQLLPNLQRLHAIDTILAQLVTNTATIDTTQEPNLTSVLDANLWCEDPSTLF